MEASYARKQLMSAIAYLDGGRLGAARDATRRALDGMGDDQPLDAIDITDADLDALFADGEPEAPVVGKGGVS